LSARADLSSPLHGLKWLKLRAGALLSNPC